jgi:hypothetical protein
MILTAEVTKETPRKRYFETGLALLNLRIDLVTFAVGLKSSAVDNILEWTV